MFVFGMASLTVGSGGIDPTKALMWVWNPLVMLMVEGHLHSLPSPEIAATLGSLAVGFLAGLIGGTLQKTGRTTQIVSTTNPDLIGTPWANNPEYTASKTVSPALKNRQNKTCGCDGEKPRS